MNTKDIIGRGGYGKVYTGKDLKTGEKVAIKVISIDDVKAKVPGFTLRQALREMTTMMQCSKVNNCHMLQLLHFELDDDEKHLYMITEFCDGTLDSLMKKKGSFTEKETVEIARQVADGLRALHIELGMTHRDLKLDNILIKDGLYKVADFGLSKFEDAKSSTNAGQNFMNMPPESVLNSTKGLPVDVWALGLMLHEMIFKKHPFLKDGAHVMSIPIAVTQQPYTIPDQPALSEGFKSLLKSCLEKDPAKRITIPQFLAHASISKPVVQPNPSTNKHAPPSNKAKAVTAMKQPTQIALANFNKLNKYEPKVTEAFKKQFEGNPVLGPYEYEEGIGGTYTGQYKDGLRCGFGKLVSSISPKANS